MKILFNFASALFALALITAAEGDPGATNPTGSPPVYDGGTLKDKVPALDGVEAKSAVDARLRAFLWRHWRQRTRAMITVVSRTIHGDRYQTVYRVEPNELGVWRLGVEARGKFYDADRGVTKDWSDRYQAFSVERVRADSQKKTKQSIISTTVNVSAKAYRLLLKDRDGNILGRRL